LYTAPLSLDEWRLGTDDDDDDDDDDASDDAMQLEMLKRNVDRTGTDLESVRAQIKQIKKDIVSKQMRYAAAVLA